MDPLKFQVHTFGCKVNTYDTGLIQRNLESSGLVLNSSEPQIHVLNTCAVTAEATKEAVRTIRRIKAKSPLSTVVVTGCAAQVDTDSFQNLPGADLVVANSHKGYLPFLIEQYFKGEIKEKVFKSNIFKKEDFEAGGGLEESHTRAFLKIQDGCNSFCTFCIIPYARGKSRSLPIRDLVQRVNDLASQGFEEIVLTGVHVGDYQDPNLSQKNALEDLLESLLAKTKVSRFRLTSLEPIELSDRLFDLYQDSRLCPHFHMSIQSASTPVLTEMKRKYTQEQVFDSLVRIQEKVPGAFVGLDVIAGFPTETDEQFEQTYELLAKAPWTRMHVFPYSERKGTKAALINPQIYPHLRKERAQKLRELSLHRYQAEAVKQIGTKKIALGLKDSKNFMCLSRDYWTVILPVAPPLKGEFEVEITELVTDSSARMEGVLRGRYV